MRFIPAAKLKPGMTIAKTIFDSNDNVLLNSNVCLNDAYITQLLRRGVIGAYIKDELSQNIIVQEAISNELRASAIKSIKELDLEKTIDIAKKIVSQLSSDNTVIFDLVDIRTFDDYTYRHSINVAITSTMVGMGMGLSYDELAELCLAALLHDIGKLQIDPAILNKAGKLTDEEFMIMKSHPSIAYEIVKDRWDISATTKIGMLLHHENCDGSGYPYGLKEAKIHRYARIIHVADVYDALTSKRPYKDAYFPAESAEYIMGNCGTLFDREAIEIFFGYVPLYPKGTEVYLSDGRRAIIAENFKYNTMRPRVIADPTGESLDLLNDANCRNITIVGMDKYEDESKFSKTIR